MNGHMAEKHRETWEAAQKADKVAMGGGVQDEHSPTSLGSYLQPVRSLREDFASLRVSCVVVI